MVMEVPLLLPHEVIHALSEAGDLQDWVFKLWFICFSKVNIYSIYFPSHKKDTYALKNKLIVKTVLTFGHPVSFNAH